MPNAATCTCIYAPLICIAGKNWWKKIVANAVKAMQSLTQDKDKFSPMTAGGKNFYVYSSTVFRIHGCGIHYTLCVYI